MFFKWIINFPFHRIMNPWSFHHIVFFTTLTFLDFPSLNDYIQYLKVVNLFIRMLFSHHILVPYLSQLPLTFSKYILSREHISSGVGWSLAGMALTPGAIRGSGEWWRGLGAPGRKYWSTMWRIRWGIHTCRSPAKVWGRLGPNAHRAVGLTWYHGGGWCQGIIFFS